MCYSYTVEAKTLVNNKEVLLGNFTISSTSSLFQDEVFARVETLIKKKTSYNILPMKILKNVVVAA